jgi:hypothetical protein
LGLSNENNSLLSWALKNRWSLLLLNLDRF